jgi:hypothetical protein
MLTRQDLQQYVEYAERLSTDLDVCIEDLKFRDDHGMLHLAVDFSEVHSFLVPDELDDSWLWPGLTEPTKAIVEHSALSEVLTGPPKPLLLPPYTLEFQSFLANQRAGVEDSFLKLVPQATRLFEELMEAPDATAMLALASSVDAGKRTLTPEELKQAVTFFETHAADLVSLIRGEVLEPLARTRRFLQTSPFASLDSVVHIRLTGREREVTARFNRLQRIRGAGKEGATFVDALALEYVKRANDELRRRGEKARVLLVSRSSNLRRLLKDERDAGLWSNGDILRHPRMFAPLAWHARRAFQSAIPQLTATKSSLDLCRRSAAFRLLGGSDRLEHSRSDTMLIDMMEDLKAQILRLVEMGGGVNESRVVTAKGAKGRTMENDVLRLLGMVRNRDEFLNAVAERMAEINAQVDREHEMLGVMLHSEDSVAREIAVTGSRSERMVVPRLGRVPYGLRFRTPSFLEWLDELRGKEVTRRDLLGLFTRAAQATADHYEMLLFMAYTLAIVGHYELANDYTVRALESAERHGRSDRDEATFFHAFCARVTARDPKRLSYALRLLASLTSRPNPDPRWVIEEANARLTWSVYALERKNAAWKKDAPMFEDSIRLLNAAAGSAHGDPRLLVSIRNNVCYAYTQLFRTARTRDNAHLASTALEQLLDTINELEPDVNHWPARIKDTIAETALLFPTSKISGEFVKHLIGTLERDLLAENDENLRKELRKRVNLWKREFPDVALS